jgi:hypothetical protein
MVIRIFVVLNLTSSKNVSIVLVSCLYQRFKKYTARSKFFNTYLKAKNTILYRKNVCLNDIIAYHVIECEKQPASRINMNG